MRYEEGSEFVDTLEDIIANGDPGDSCLEEMEGMLKQRIENLKTLELYHFGLRVRWKCFLGCRTYWSWYRFSQGEYSQLWFCL